MDVKTTSKSKKTSAFKRVAKGMAKGAGVLAKGFFSKTFRPIRNFIVIGAAAAAFLPIWKVDGFPDERQSGINKYKKYKAKKAADKKAGEYYHEQREKLKDLKKQRGIQDTEKDNQKVTSEVVTEKNQIIEKYKDDSKGWREEIAKEKGMPIDYINDVIDSKTHLSEKDIEDGNKLLKPYSIEMLRDAGDVLDRDVEYKPEGVSNQTSSLNDVPELDFASEAEYTQVASHEVDLGNGARGIDHGDTLIITRFGTNAQSMGVDADAPQKPSAPRVQAQTFNA